MDDGRYLWHSFISLRQSINLSHNLFFCPTIDCFFTRIIPDCRQKWRRRIVAHTASTWYVFAWVVVEGGKISSLTLVFKLFCWSFPQAVCQDYRCLPLPVFPSFPYVFQFHFRQLWKFLLQVFHNSMVTSHDKSKRLLVFSVTQFKIDQNKNQNRSIDKVQNLGNETR